MTNNLLRTLPILSVRQENLNTKTFSFKDKLCAGAEPGQFLMLWIPGVDEIPLSIMNAEKGVVSVTVKSIGVATKALSKMENGEIIGVRGPFGNSFTQNSGRILLVGGGTGIAPLFFLGKKIINKAKKITFVIGAKTKKELLFLSSIKELCKTHTLLSTTEDGSHGVKCIVTDALKTFIKCEKYDLVYACGPELMLRSIFDLTEKYKIPMQASLERFMRCGIGLCGSCIIGKHRVCRDGPIFNSEKLRELKDEFGISKLDECGKKIYIKEQKIQDYDL
jgi:dihydroorotate dehydrogenase electron transfer subunit